MKKPILIFVLLTLSFTLSAQGKMFHHISVANGLASNTVLCSVQDKDGFMWFGTKEGLCRYDGYDFQTAVGGVTSPLLSHRIRALDVDDDGLIWIASVNGVGYLNPDNYEASIIKAIPNDIYHSIITDKWGNIWLINQKIIISYNKYSGILKEFPADDFFSSLSTAKDSYGNVWFSSTEGTLYGYNDNEFTAIKTNLNDDFTYLAMVNPTMAVVLTSSLKLLHVDLSSGETKELAVLPPTNISFGNICVKDNEYWIGGDKGIFIYDNNTGDLCQISNDSNTAFSLTCNSVKHLYADKTGNMWVSTYFDGINLNLNDQNSFIKLCIGNNNMNGQIVRAMYKHKNEVWLGTEDGGLSIYNVDSEIVTDASYLLGENASNIHNFAVRGNIMWISTYGNGIFTINIDTKKLVNHYHFGNDYISYITIANDGSVYATATNGLYHKRANSDSFNFVDNFSESYLVGVFQDSEAGLWVLSDGNGLWYKAATSDTFDNYRFNDGSGLPGDILFYCFEDKERRMWITSEGGGIGYTSYKEIDSERLSFTTLTEADGIPSNTTCAITEDNFGSLWLSTSKGLVELDSKNLEVKSLYNGLYRMNDYTFTNQAVHKDNESVIYFGTNKGFSYFDPREDISQDFSLHITYAYSGYKHKPISLSHNKPLNLSEKGKFSFKDAQVITFHYAAINFPMQHSLLYDYELKRKGWNIKGISPENNVSFTHLKPGNYHFCVSLHGQEYEDVQCYEFSIARPLYRSRGAVFMYILLAITLLYYQYKKKERKIENEKKRQLEIFEAKRQQSIYETKIDFYTQISHQLKTPLTLIKMPLEKILNEIDESNSIYKELLTVKSNADRLLELSNHLLHLRKSEKDKHSIKITRVNISEVVRKAYHSFDYILENSSINATLSLEDKDIEILTCEDSVDKIVSNLIDNAIKYSKKSIKVSLNSDLVKGVILFRVESDGSPIQGEDRIDIFKPFVRVKDSKTEGGTGLGLSIALNLAEKLKGKLYLDDNNLDINVFTLELPIRTETATKLESEDSVETTETADGIKTILLVEDSEDLLDYLAGELSSEYKVLKAGNGKVAMDILKVNKVNMIVSDIMMPEVDGCELCNYTKTTIDYSHIPFIMISAASEQSETIERLKVGAEAYIEKPFNIDVLRSSINSLFKNKEISNTRLSNMPLTEFNNPSMSKVDAKFMNNVYSMVEEHLSDVNLSFEMLSDLTKTSKSTLYRKIKANTGLNVNEYIRLCRLKKAADMLISSDYKMDEIAFLVGFASSSYFSTCFKKQFSLTPSAFVKKYKNV